MSVRDLLADLSRLGVQVWIDGERLGIRAPRGVLTPALRARLAASKQELLALLGENPRDAASAGQEIKTARNGEIPLSFAQQRVWFVDQLDPGTPTYTCPYTYRLRGEVDLRALDRTIREIVRRHESLRTTFESRAGRPVQVVSPVSSVHVSLIDLRGLPEDTRQAHARALAVEEAHFRFDLHHGPLLRCNLVRLDDQEHLLLITLHHIAIDGWSFVIFAREMTEIYSATAAGRRPALDEPRLQYADFAVWEQQLLRGERLENKLEYWKQMFADGVPVLDLPGDGTRTADALVQARRQPFEIPAPLSRALDDLCQQERATLFAALLAVYGVLLQRYTGQTDIVVGCPIAARTRSEVEGMIGCFMNPLPLRLDLSGDPTFRELLGRVRQIVLGALAHQDTPFDALVRALRPSRKPTQTPLFQVMFLQHNYPQAQSLALAGLDVEYIDLSHDLGGELQYPMIVEFVRAGASIFGLLSYHPDLATTMAGTADHLRQLLAQLTAHPDRPIHGVSMLSDQERQQLLIDWNRTCVEFPETQCVNQLFEAQAEQHPDAVAISCEEHQLTYRDLSQRANQLAHYLRELGVGPEVRVGICVRRSPEMVVGLLGILKAGGAYVPLDPEYPEERLTWMVKDSRAPVIVSEQAVLERVPPSEATWVRLDADRGRIVTRSVEEPRRRTTPDNLAYVIYTSGSTGQPKGTQLTHRGLCNLARWQQRVFPLGPGARVLQFASLSFDASTWELAMTVFSGATLVLARGERLTPGGWLEETLSKERVTVATLPPSVLSVTREGPLPLATLISAGEQCPSEVASRWGQEHRFVNAYGPTESTVCATTWEYREDGARVPPIGRPIANTEAYVLDPMLQPVPLGVSGELYLGGAGIARGYWDRPQLTGERFVPHPFAHEPGARLYRTGDRVRYQREGNLQFLGRLDRQIKVRGYRIEPGEIEAVLRQDSSVRDAAVVVHEDESRNPFLVGYVVLDRAHATKLLPTTEAANERGVPSGLARHAATLRRQLAKKLPDHMVPSAVVFLDDLPRTTSGKLDRTSLPLPDRQRQVEAVFVAPRNDLETKIAAIWQAVLDVDKVGIRDNFFDLGGHSLLLVQLQARLVEQLDCDISLVNLYEYTTIEALAERIGNGDRSTSDFTERARARVGRRNGAGRENIDVAIVGMAGRFPQAPDLESFWDLLRRGVEAIHFFTDDELRRAGVDDAYLNDPNYVKAFAVLDGIDLFDAPFFAYSPRDAELIDPQQRLFLECAWHALEVAGYDPQRCRELIGVYAGSSMNTYALTLTGMRDPSSSSRGYLLGSDKDHLATRVSYKLDLHGPGVTVQAACSTSLLAVHQAWQALQCYECDMALAGGVSAAVPAIGHVYDEQYILSPDGHCRPFDIDAQGTLAGSGVGVVVLKRLPDALADGDEIHAVIKGAAANNDGSQKVGYYAPSVDGQAQVIAMALAAAGVDAESITYVEAHGTGTKMGDPIEVAALTKVFREQTPKKRFCAIGSLKSNMGHLDAAAGIAGLIKTVLALKNRQIPPSLNFHHANPKCNFDESPFFVNTELCAWDPPRDEPRRAGVSAFGIGGTNVHVVLEEAPSRRESSTSRTWQVLPLAAKTPAALERMGKNLADRLNAQPELPLADVAYTLQVGRQQFDHRRVVVCRDRAQAIAALESTAAANAGSRATEAQQRQVVFLLPGQGSQYPGMGRQLYQSERVFREIVDLCSVGLEQHLGWDIRELLLAEQASESLARRLQQPAACQAVLFSLELALARQWMHWGVRPAACLGHSIGEYVAASVCGVLDVEDALALVARRGQLMQQAPPGAMLAVGLSAAAVASYLDDRLWLAADNAPELCVVSGSQERIVELRQRLESEQIQCRQLHTGGAFHSGLMQDVVEPLTALARDIGIRSPVIPYLSDVTGTWITEEDLQDPAYWGRHVQSTVRFREAVGELAQLKDPVLLEIGPGQALGTLVRQQGEGPGTILATLPDARQAKSDEESITRAVGGLWLEGVRLDWAAYYEDQRRRRVVLPTYPFQRERYWISPVEVPSRSPSLLQRKDDVADWFYRAVWKASPKPEKPAQDPSPGAGALRLMFSDDSPVARKIADELRGSGYQVCEVFPGAAFRRFDETRYEIDVRKRADYLKLVRELKQSGRRPSGVTHVWAGVDGRSLEPSAAAGDADGSGLDTGFLSLLYLAQALGENDVTSQLRLDVVTSCVHPVRNGDPVDPAQATVLGPCRVLPQESPHLVCRNLDLLPLDDGSFDSRDLKALLADVRSSSNEVIVAYREGQRLVQRFEPQRLESGGGPGSGLLRHRGVYLITGGLGGMGLQFAEELARSCEARLVLTSRSGLPERDRWPGYLADETHTEGGFRGSGPLRSAEPRDGFGSIREKIRAVQALEKLGAEVLVAAADVADAQQMQRVVSSTLARFERIDGVIHAAGIAGGGVVQLKKPSVAAEVFAPKVTGIRVLEDVLAGLPLDFLVLASSSTSVLGGPGQVDYCAANAYLDAYASHFAAQTGTYCVAVNWGPWRDVGMSVDTDLPESMREQHSAFLRENGISNAEGREALRRILAHQPAPQILVSPVNYFQAAPATADPSRRNAATSTVGRGKKRSDIGDWLYVPSWTRSSLTPLPGPAEQSKATGPWLVLLDELARGQLLIDRLESSGHSAVTVVPGPRFERLAEDRYQVRADQAADYARLMQQLAADSKTPATVLHLWGAGQTSPSEASRGRGARARARPYVHESLMVLAQMLEDARTPSPLRIVLVTSGVHEVVGGELLLPETAAVTGLARVIPQEYPGWTCKCIDVASAEWHDGDALSGELAERLLREAESDATEPIVAYRGGYRWVQAFQPLPLAPAEGTPARLRDEGVYWITGGLGDIGSKMAGYLAEAVRARLILTGRSGLPAQDQWDTILRKADESDATAQRIRRVRRLQELGAEVLVLRADACDAEQMRAAWHAAIDRFGTLHGVIHAAGVLGADQFLPISKTDRQLCSEQLRPKLDALYVLADLLEDQEPDFCLLVSSLSSLLGGLGHGAYASANAAMDAFAHMQNQRRRFPWITVNWDTWVRAEDEARLGRTGQPIAGFAMSESEGIGALDRILSYDVGPQIIVSTGDLQARVEQWVNPGAAGEATGQEAKGARHPRPTLQTEYEAPRNEIEQTLAELWADMFGLEQVGIHDNFFELGGHSLMATQLTSQLRDTYEGHVSVEQLFEAPTIAELATLIMERLLETQEEATDEALLEELEGLSAEDVERALASDGDQ